MMFLSVARPTALVLGQLKHAAGQCLTLSAKATQKHMHPIGLSGYGKSRFMTSYFIQLMHKESGVALIDPHGDTALEVLSSLHRQHFFRREDAFDRLIYFDWGRADRFPAFNWLDQPYSAHQVAQDFLKALKRSWSSLEGGVAPQLENIVLASALVLAQTHRPITDLQRLLTEPAFRNSLLAEATDHDIVAFFQQRFDRLGRGASHTIESTLRRIFLLTFSPGLKYSLGASRNQMRFREHMDQGINVIHNLSGLDEYCQRLLGSLLAVSYEIAALSREDTPPSHRRPYHLMLEEFSMFSEESEESLARTLDLTRKYGVFLTLSHQTFSQLTGRMQGALQNATHIAFRLGHNDANLMAPYLTDYNPTMLKADPLHLRKTSAYAGVEEQSRLTAGRLRNLQPGEALVRLNNRTYEIKTIRVPDYQPSPALAALIEHYARTFQFPPPDQSPLPAPDISPTELPFKMPDRSRARVDVTQGKGVVDTETDH